MSIVQLDPFQLIRNVNFGIIIVDINIGSNATAFRGDLNDTGISASSGSCSMTVNGIPFFADSVSSVSAGGTPIFEDTQEFIPPGATEESYIYKIFKLRDADSNTPPGGAVTAQTGLRIRANVGRIQALGPAGIEFIAAASLGFASGTHPIEPTQIGRTISAQLYQDGVPIGEELTEFETGSLTCVYKNGELTRS